MVNKSVCKNSKISNPQKSLEFLQELDLERFHDLGLASRVVFYLGKGQDSNRITREYEGAIHVIPDTTGGLIHYPIERIFLPFPKRDFKWYKQDESREAMIYFSNELNGPGEIEFDIHARNNSGYQGLDALRKVIIPEFFRKGYDKGSAEHTSIFLLHLSKKDEDFKDSILNTSCYGLSVKSKEVDGVKVFTDSDLSNFRRMYYN